LLFETQICVSKHKFDRKQICVLNRKFVFFKFDLFWGKFVFCNNQICALSKANLRFEIQIKIAHKNTNLLYERQICVSKHKFLNHKFLNHKFQKPKNKFQNLNLRFEICFFGKANLLSKTQICSKKYKFVV